MQIQAAPRQARELPTPGGTAPELTTPGRCGMRKRHPVIGIIEHGHNGALDLLLARCALTCSPPG
jgi:hypothetical protein